MSGIEHYSSAYVIILIGILIVLIPFLILRIRARIIESIAESLFLGANVKRRTR